MNAIHIEFEDPAHLQSQIAYLYERICEPVGRGIASIAMFDDEELHAEVARRAAAAKEAAGEADQAADKPARSRKRLAAVAPTAPAPSPAPTPAPAPAPAEPEPEQGADLASALVPQPEPQPDPAALPAKPEPVDTSAGAVAPVVPSQDDLQMVMGYIVATAGNEKGIQTVRDIMSRVANAKSLKTARLETWPELMRVMLETLGMTLEQAREADAELRRAQDEADKKKKAGAA